MNGDLSHVHLRPICTFPRQFLAIQLLPFLESVNEREREREVPRIPGIKVIDIDFIFLLSEGYRGTKIIQPNPSDLHFLFTYGFHRSQN